MRGEGKTSPNPKQGESKMISYPRLMRGRKFPVSDLQEDKQMIRKARREIKDFLYTDFTYRVAARLADPWDAVNKSYLLKSEGFRERVKQVCDEEGFDIINDEGVFNEEALDAIVEDVATAYEAMRERRGDI